MNDKSSSLMERLKKSIGEIKPTNTQGIIHEGHRYVVDWESPSKVEVPRNLPNWIDYMCWAHLSKKYEFTKESLREFYTYYNLDPTPYENFLNSYSK